MSDNPDYTSGYRGDQFHHGMDRNEYERGRSQKELIETLGGGNKKIEVDGPTFGLILASPFVWMVYPVMGFTMMGVVAGLVLLAKISPIHPAVEFLIAIFPAVMSFFWGMKLEGMVSQFTVYRWIRGILRIVFSFGLIAGLAAGKDVQSFNDIPAGALVGGFFGAVIAYLTFQRLDLIYFRSNKEIKKFKEQLAKGERPKRPMLKRLFFGFCWFIPVMVVLTLIVAIVLRTFLGHVDGREAFTKQYGPMVGGINVVIWYLLCLTGKLPGTGKYMFNERHEEDIRQL